MFAGTKGCIDRLYLPTTLSFVQCTSKGDTPSEVSDDDAPSEVGTS